MSIGQIIVGAILIALLVASIVFIIRTPLGELDGRSAVATVLFVIYLLIMAAMGVMALVFAVHYAITGTI